MIGLYSQMTLDRDENGGIWGSDLLRLTIVTPAFAPVQRQRIELLCSETLSAKVSKPKQERMRKSGRRGSSRGVKVSSHPFLVGMRALKGGSERAESTQTVKVENGNRKCESANLGRERSSYKRCREVSKECLGQFTLSCSGGKKHMR